MSEYDLSYVTDAVDTDVTDSSDEIDASLLEKRLEGLRDTQESVQGLSLWCQANKRHSQIITDTWLKILRKSPVEKRLTMFYLANDVVQHAKRKSDTTVVNQWAFAVQKATPHVRSPSSVSTAITRIFKIWEERGIYSKDAVADLLSLLNNSSSKDKVEKKGPETYTASAEKVATFQPSQLISKIKLASRLKSHLGATFRTKSYCQMTPETLKNSIKDRQHGQEVIQEMGSLVEQLRTSEMKLQAEVEERRKVREIGEIAIVFYENIRSESKIVNAAYKNFTSRVMRARDAVESKLKSFEEMEKEPSPCPSPPAAAPSPVDTDEFNPEFMMSSGATSFNPSDILKAASSVEIFENKSSGMEYSDHKQSVTSGYSSDYHSMEDIPMPPPFEPESRSYEQEPAPTSAPAFDPMTMNMHMQNWPAIMMNYQNQQSHLVPAMADPSFIPPAIRLQMQMQQQHIQAYGFPQDASAMPLSTPMPGPPTLNPPPPPEEINPYPPPPPQPIENSVMQNSMNPYSGPPPPPPPPVHPGNDHMTMHDPMHSYSGDPGIRPPENFLHDDRKYGPPDEYGAHNQQSSNFDYQGSAHVTQESMYTGNSSNTVYNSGTASQEFHTSMIPKNISYESNQDMPPQNRPPENSDYDFNKGYDDHQREYEQDQYSPQKVHPYTPPQRGRRGQHRPPVQRTLQPLVQTGAPLFQPRNHNPQYSRPPRPLLGNFGNANTVPLGKPPELPSPSNNHGNRLTPLLSLAGYPTDDNPFTAMNHEENGNEGNSYQEDRFQLQQGSGRSNSFEDNQQNTPYHNRGKMRGNGFRGNFHGSPRIRGIRPNGPRRGRY